MIRTRRTIFTTALPILSGILFCLTFLHTCERFEPKSLLVFRTESVDVVSVEQYDFFGRIINIGDKPIQDHGFCWSESRNPTVDGERTSLGSREMTGVFSSSVARLAYNTTYYVRAYVTIESGIEYGEEMEFRTLPPRIPTVLTGAVTDITDNSAISGGEVIDDGGAAVTARGVCWSSSPGPTLADNHTTDGPGTGGFTSVITGLNCSNEYYVRAYATTSDGTGYGDEISFTTMPCIPEEAEFLMSDQDGIWIVSHEGIKTAFSAAGGRDIEVFENKVFVRWGKDLDVYTPQGGLIRSVTLDNRVSGYRMCVLPGENLAILDNATDSVTFTNPSGMITRVMSFTNQPPGEDLQNISGVVVDNSLIISETGTGQIVKIDLGSYEWSVLRDLSHLTGWLGDIDHQDGTYYVCKSMTIFSFREGEPEQLVCQLPEGNNSSIAVLGNFAYVASNHGDKIYRVNLQNGDYEVLLSDANYPQEIELIK